MKRSPLKRKSPRTRKGATEATRCCHVRYRGEDTPPTRCTKVGRVIVYPTERYCGTHATKVADKLVGDAVRARDGRCMFADVNDQPCDDPGTLYWCHIFRKGTYPSLRYRMDNAVAACRLHHFVFDNYEIERWDWIARHIPRQALDELMARRLMPGPKVADVIRSFRDVAA